MIRSGKALEAFAVPGRARAAHAWQRPCATMDAVAGMEVALRVLKRRQVENGSRRLNVGVGGFGAKLSAMGLRRSEWRFLR